jgi:beta-glucosidase
VTPVQNGDAKVTFTVTNNGTMAGTAVPQVYLGAPSVTPAGTQFAVRALSAFDRVTLKAGQATQVSLTIKERELSYWNTTSNTWTVATSTRQVLVGNSSRDLSAVTTYRAGH